MADTRPKPIRGKLTPSLLTSIATAVIGLLTAFQVFDLDEVQIGAIMSAVGVLGIVLTSLGILGSEGEVTPVSDPQLPEGTLVKTTDDSGNVTGATRL